MKSIDSMTLREKIIGGFMIIVAVFLVVSIVICVQLFSIRSLARSIEQETEIYTTVADVSVNFASSRANILRLLYYQDGAYITQIRATEAASSALLDELLSYIDESNFSASLFCPLSKSAYA